MEVLERISVAERGTVKKYERLEDDPEFWKNHPLNVDDLTAEELIARWNKSVDEFERTGKCMTLEEVRCYFKEKYGI